MNDTHQAEAAITKRDDAIQTVVEGKYIPGFDGLRAIAVLIVLIAHAGYDRAVPGGLGVTIFFAISGFLITNLLANEIRKSETIDLRSFYTRRIIRLYPELLLLIAMCLIAGKAIGFKADIVEKLAGIFYYMNYYHVFGEHYQESVTYPWRHLWSLAIEEHFYFLFPGLMLFVAHRFRLRLQLVIALATLPALWRLVTYFYFELPWQYNYVATDTRIDSIAWGCLLALVIRRDDGTARTIDDLRFINRPMLAGGLAIILGTLLYRNEAFRWTWRFTLQGIGIALVMANLLFDPRWKSLVRVLEWGPVRYIGRISYGLYLYHMLINRLIEQAWPMIPPRTLLPTSVVFSLAAATLSYQLLEVPLKPLRRKLGSHTR